MPKLFVYPDFSEDQFYALCPDCQESLWIPTRGTPSEVREMMRVNDEIMLQVCDVDEVTSVLRLHAQLTPDEHPTLVARECSHLWCRLVRTSARFVRRLIRSDTDA